MGANVEIRTEPRRPRSAICSRSLRSCCCCCLQFASIKKVSTGKAVQYFLVWPSTSAGIESDVVQHQAELTACLSSFSLSRRTTNRRERKVGRDPVALFPSATNRLQSPVNNGDWNTACARSKAHSKKRSAITTRNNNNSSRHNSSFSPREENRDVKKQQSSLVKKRPSQTRTTLVLKLGKRPPSSFFFSGSRNIEIYL